MSKKKTVKNKSVATGIAKGRAIVRPITIIYSVFILSVLAIMAMSGFSMPVEGVGANIVNAFIGIAGANTVEYSIEHGVLNIMGMRKRNRESR